MRCASGEYMRTPRRNFAAAVLFDGTVFLTGGYDQKGHALAATEIYDPLTGISIDGPSLRESRAGHQAYTLPNNGKVMIAGGTDGANPLATVEIYTPWTGRLQSSARMHTARTAMAAVLTRRGGSWPVVRTLRATSQAARSTGSQPSKAIGITTPRRDGHVQGPGLETR
jgi:hypothetical protein